MEIIFLIIGLIIGAVAIWFISSFNSTGAHQWSKRLGTSIGDYARAIASDSEGNVVIVGRMSGNGDVNGDGDNTDGGAESSSGYG